MDKILVSDKQRFALNRLIGSVSGVDRVCRLYIISQLIGREIQSSADVLEDEWREICREAYPHRFKDVSLQ